MRGVLAVLGGAVVWAVLWLSLNQGLLSLAPETFSLGEPITSTGGLALLWAASVAFSVIAGYVTGVIGPGKEVAYATALGVLQTGLGIFFQAQSWELMPIGYHVLFLAALLPGNVLGGLLRARRGGAGQSLGYLGS